jgi:hypothetical protein
MTPPHDQHALVLVVSLTEALIITYILGHTTCIYLIHINQRLAG